jgi:hypothetical protein
MVALQKHDSHSANCLAPEFSGNITVCMPVFWRRELIFVAKRQTVDAVILRDPRRLRFSFNSAQYQELRLLGTPAAAIAPSPSYWGSNHQPRLDFFDEKYFTAGIKIRPAIEIT